MAEAKIKMMKCSMEGCAKKNLQLISSFRPFGQSGVRACQSCCSRLAKIVKSAEQSGSNSADKENEPPGAACSFLSLLITNYPPPGRMSFPFCALILHFLCSKVCFAM